VIVSIDSCLEMVLGALCKLSQHIKQQIKNIVNRQCSFTI
jgi:hypothetical protein